MRSADRHADAHAAALTLSRLAAAPDDRAAWPRWRELERCWAPLTAADRRELKAAARRLMRSGAEVAGRLSVVAKLPE